MNLRTVAILLQALTIGASAQAYRVSKSIPLPGSDAWDYLRADATSHRLYVSHGTTVQVVDTDSLKPVGQLTGFGFIHGIVLIPGRNLGFLSDGQKDELVTFDPERLLVTGHIKTAANPNSMVYDERNDRLFIGHKPSRSTTVLNVTKSKIEKVIPLDGIPEFPVTDGSSVFVNLEDKDEILRIDAESLTVRGHFPLKPCKGPSGLAIDTIHHHLFSACDNKTMVILDSNTGALVESLPIGGEPDAAAFDTEEHTVFSSNGDGTLTIMREMPSGHFKVVQNLRTTPGARTMALNNKTHRIFLSAAKLGPPPRATRAVPNPPKHPTAVPGSFHVVVVEPNQ